MRRRQFSTLAFTAGVTLLLRHAHAATSTPSLETVKGKLIQHGSAPSTLQTPSGQSITLSGDDDSQKVLHDPRLAGVTLEGIGHFTTPGNFALKPHFEKDMFVHKDGQRLLITYWCDICAIRTYAPGVCVCCQKWTDLDLRDPNQE